MVRDLKGTVEREKAAMGIFLTLEGATREMRREATTAGMYHVWDRDQRIPVVAGEVAESPLMARSLSCPTGKQSNELGWQRPPKGTRRRRTKRSLPAQLQR